MERILEIVGVPLFPQNWLYFATTAISIFSIVNINEYKYTIGLHLAVWDQKEFLFSSLYGSELLLVLIESKPHGSGRAHPSIAFVMMAPGELVHRDQHEDLAGALQQLNIVDHTTLAECVLCFST